jgi:hypothetical protein
VSRQDIERDEVFKVPQSHTPGGSWYIVLQSLNSVSLKSGREKCEEPLRGFDQPCHPLLWFFWRSPFTPPVKNEGQVRRGPQQSSSSSVSDFRNTNALEFPDICLIYQGSFRSALAFFPPRLGISFCDRQIKSSSSLRGLL